jgi:hypothetical protein
MPQSQSDDARLTTSKARGRSCAASGYLQSMWGRGTGQYTGPEHAEQGGFDVATGWPDEICGWGVGDCRGSRLQHARVETSPSLSCKAVDRLVLPPELYPKDVLVCTELWTSTSRLCLCSFFWYHNNNQLSLSLSVTAASESFAPVFVIASEFCCFFYVSTRPTPTPNGTKSNRARGHPRPRGREHRPRPGAAFAVDWVRRGLAFWVSRVEKSGRGVWSVVDSVADG